ncbi:MULTISPECIES: SCP2 sterol-binding domain-containing protein [Acinetobacter]|jgi:putative sterol carrier protein|uniref:SCP2 sterol-binding domain-containing protein n=1 Tax=Acinetobacter pollinis TaxID=2605270 RepID=A0ABU6DQM3_9GAMM|nr:MULTISPECIES: SCP2 sterol-binding domain-containing protein [Acinetobacter]MBF7691088.1 SCP2 sterol-binding domain-containing protein [Acinetobacter pollinis]MBF7693624.1 SCP2 sterol-binding domain-containing protein [Acinetobacter pollinis]MBF7698727.1 SCP2 sterol-binding domain-containing protein [Acinetobacter pollinis]MBF7701463.1 SCP2 sterol-binding domain-containing protein [Acinetobacter pollinis]MEB5476020.1 SCP2 sterol-binding domain-containing protein [Acinetobacter pollinis]
MPAFLTEAWFSKVDELTTQAGDLNLSPALQSLAINFIVSDVAKGVTELSLASGKFKKGLADNAKTTLNMDADTLKKVFLQFDMTAAMQAFMTGKIKVQGDMSQLMTLQTAKPSQEQKALFKEILAHTE